MTPSLCSSERWLLLDEGVFHSVRAAADDPSGLLRLRLEQKWVEPVAPGGVVRHLRSLATAGCRRAHVVATRLDHKLLRSLRPLVSDELQIAVHDWYLSSVDVMAGLDAPDRSVTDLLARGRPAGPIALWPALATDAGTRVVGRYRSALRHWEVGAREEHGEVFTSFYGPSIDWDELLPAWSREASHHWRLGTMLEHLLRRLAPSQITPPARQFGYASTPAGPTAGSGERVWTYDLGRGDVLEIQLELPSRPGANVQFYAALPRGAQGPIGLTLIGEHDEPLLSVDRLEWTADGPGGEQIAYRVFPDEFGDLRTRIESLQSQPGLMVL